MPSNLLVCNIFAAWVCSGYKGRKYSGVKRHTVENINFFFCSLCFVSSMPMRWCIIVYLFTDAISSVRILCKCGLWHVCFSGPLPYGVWHRYSRPIAYRAWYMHCGSTYRTNIHCLQQHIIQQKATRNGSHCPSHMDLHFYISTCCNSRYLYCEWMCHWNTTHLIIYHWSEMP